MSAVSTIRHDLASAKELAKEWNETKQVANLVPKIQSIQTDAIRSYAATTFFTRKAISDDTKAQLLQIVQAIDLPLHASLSNISAEELAIKRANSKALKKMKNAYGPVDESELQAIIDSSKQLNNTFLRSKLFSKMALLQEDASLLKEITSESMRAYATHKLNMLSRPDVGFFEAIIGAVVSIPVAALVAVWAAGITSVGVIASLASCATGGIWQESNQLADEWTRYAKTCLAEPYRTLWPIQMLKTAKQERENVGFITKKVTSPIFDQALHAAKESDFLHRHILSRGLFLIAGLVATVTRAVDFSFGLAAAAISLFPCFLLYRKINSFAYVQLKSMGVIYDVTAAFRGFINPQQFLK